jgi:hypothetical protein
MLLDLAGSLPCSLSHIYLLLLFWSASVTGTTLLTCKSTIKKTLTLLLLATFLLYFLISLRLLLATFSSPRTNPIHHCLAVQTVAGCANSCWCAMPGHCNPVSPPPASGLCSGSFGWHSSECWAYLLGCLWAAVCKMWWLVPHFQAPGSPIGVEWKVPSR